MVTLVDKETGAAVGEITDAQLQFLIDHLEEEFAEDVDYYINVATLELLEEQGSDPGLMAVLRQAMGTRDEMEIRWSRART